MNKPVELQVIEPKDIPPFMNEIPYKILQYGLTFGLIVWSYTCKEYIQHAVETGGYETILLWGIQGCLPGSTKILTDKGPRSIKHIFDINGSYVLSDNKGIFEFNFATPFFAGFQRVFAVITSIGSFQATQEHPFYTSHGQKKLSELRVGDKLKYLRKPQIDKVSYHALRRMPTGISNTIQNPEILLQKLPHQMVEQTSPLQITHSKNEATHSGQNSSILQGASQTEGHGNTNLSNMRKTFHHTFFFQPSVLFQIMRNKAPQHCAWQSSVEDRNTAKGLGNEESVLCWDDQRRDEAETALEGADRQDQCPLCHRLDQVTSARAKCLSEGVLQASSRKTLTFHSEKKLYDSFGTRNPWSSNAPRFSYSLEQGITTGGSVSFPRFSGIEHQHSCRMQRVLLASEPRKGSQEKATLRTERLSPDNLGRKDNQAGNASDYQEATVLSIIPLTCEPVYNLEVANANNFFLANGVLTHNSAKSNRTLAQGYWVYEDWDEVLKHLVFSPSQTEGRPGLLQVLKGIPKGKRIPWLGWDDMTVHYPSSAWRTDIQKYEAIDSAWAALRTKANVMSLNCPLIDRAAKNIKDNVTIEVFIGRNQVELIERYLRLPGLQQVESNFYKVQVEPLKQFDIYDVPTDVFKEYWQERLALADEALEKLGNVFTRDEIDLDKYVPGKVAVKELRISPISLKHMANDGMIRATKFNGIMYVNKDDYDNVLVPYYKKKKHLDD